MVEFSTISVRKCKAKFCPVRYCSPGHNFIEIEIGPCLLKSVHVKQSD